VNKQNIKSGIELDLVPPYYSNEYRIRLANALKLHLNGQFKRFQKSYLIILCIVHLNISYILCDLKRRYK